MRTRHLALLAMWLVIAVGCGSTARQETGDSRAPRPFNVAAEGEAAAPDQEPECQVAEQIEPPPHVFYPSSHPPVYRYGARSAPDLDAMPRLAMRFDQCFGRGSLRRPAPIATQPAKKNGGRKAKSGGRATPSAGSSALSGAGAGQVVGGSKGTPWGSGSRAKKPASSASSAVKSERARDDAMTPAPSSAATPSVDAAPAERMYSAPAGGAEGDYSMEAEEEAYVAPPIRRDKKRIAGGEEANTSVIARPECKEPPPSDDDRYDDWGQAVYLSNDDTMSLSSAQRVIYAIDNFLPLPAEHIRPHELLNYFSFDTANVADGFDFSVVGDMESDPGEPGIYTLGLAVRGRPEDKTSRRNAAITLVIDRSGSMSDEGRMEYLKRGLLRMLDELKIGDMVHIVLFDHELCVPMENFVVGRDDTAALKKVIDALEPRGATDLHLGLSKGYEIADRSYQSGFSNRVILITDALANTGVTDERMISMISKYYDSRQIRLSGVGVGREFNDYLLDRLTERGKGAYVFLGSEAEVDAVFGSRFISLIETTALDVHFRLHLPPSLRMNVFYGEESSTVKEDVQEIHYFANTSQLFLSDLMARGGKLRTEDSVMLGIEYRDPETGDARREEYAFNLGALTQSGKNVAKARVVMAFIDILADLASRPYQGPSPHGGAGLWSDPEGWQRCEDGRQELTKLAASVQADREIGRVMDLFEKYCARYERPRHPVKREVASPDEGWPGATAPRR